MDHGYMCKPHPWEGHAWGKIGWAPVLLVKVEGGRKGNQANNKMAGRKMGSDSKDDHPVDDSEGRGKALDGLGRFTF